MDKSAVLSTQKIKPIDTSIVNFQDLYNDDYRGKWELRKLFIAWFHIIPDVINIYKINCIKANDWLLNIYQPEIQDCYYEKKNTVHDSKIEYGHIYYLLFDDLIVHLNFKDDHVGLLYRKTDTAIVNKLTQEMQKMSIPKQASDINILYNDSRQGLSLKPLSVNKPKQIIEDNYNDDLMPVHKIIVNRLSTDDDKGLVLLHGKPGTGKTSYIRYLITETNKNAIFLPPSMAYSINDPQMMKILIDHPNSILVIEDAENIIIDREKKGCSPVSALLNLSDGLLSDCLNIQIICSFNTDLSKVDNALMRKGRLIAKYEFKELCAGKAQALSDKLGFSKKIDSPMTLTAIYNQDERDFQQIQRRTIGFGAFAAEKQAV
ncbi:MAG: ATP-binding protein [Prevotellaceae bacterium]|jgi:hypothetical protein|nr:ATP-binding protein [Prevotellaceae bacterium]